jgi:CxxC motif-containing protein (DUF1111 family)
MTRRNIPVLLCLITLAAALTIIGGAQATNEAASGFGTPAKVEVTGADVSSNGLVDNDTFADDFGAFSEPEGVDEGLGPTYNSTRCAECHNNVAIGGGSQISELRVGHNDAAGNFVNPSITLDNSGVTIPNRSLINDRAICEGTVSKVPGTEDINALRMTTNTLGDGFVEAVDSNVLAGIAAAQPGQSGGQIAGQFIQVPVAEAGGAVRGGRFGWKNQQASLLSFSADAYLNEQGITSRFATPDVTSVCDTVADPEDQTDPVRHITDIDKFAEFMRATRVIPRDTVQAARADATAGAQTFTAIGCAICHVQTLTTVATGTVINQGQFTVPAALGNKTFHPFGDFLLHNVGTGDGIVQNGGQATANKMRTQPLWGLRLKDRLMHDGLTFTRNNAILRHAGEATGVINNYRALSNTQKNNLIAFLQSL